jgi:O-antigen ligase
MLFFFPKEIFIAPSTGALLYIGFDIKNISISMYQILNVFFVLAILVTIFKNKSANKNNTIPPKIKLLYKIYILLFIVGILSLTRNIFSDNYLEVDLYRTLFDSSPSYGGLWDILVGLIVFKASTLYINNQNQVERILKIMMYGCVALSVEFTLFKFFEFGDLLPNFLSARAFEGIGGFRSTIQGSSLFVSQLLILGIAATIYFFNKLKKNYYVLLIFFFCFMIIYTNHRTSFLSAIVLIFIMLYLNKRIIGKFVLYSTITFVLITGFLNIWSPTSHKFQNQLSSILDPNRVKSSGYFGTVTTESRLGLSFRAIDVFLFDPLFGAGPGNVVVYMGSSIVPNTLKKYIPLKSEFIWDGYQSVASGHRLTNSHNLYIQVICEYGIMGLLAILITFFVIRSNYRVFKKDIFKRAYYEQRTLYQIKAFAYSVIIGFSVYYLFQAVLLLWGVFFLVLRFTFLEQNNPTAGALRKNMVLRE